MIKRVTIRRIGGSIGVMLPKEILDRLRIRAGDEMFVLETENGLLLTPCDPNFERAQRLYARFRRKYRNALRELA